MIGEERGKAMDCVCVWRGKHVGSVVKKSLLDCWSSVEGCLPVPTPPGHADLCVYVLLIVCIHRTQQQKASAWSYVCSQCVRFTPLIHVKLHGCVSVNGVCGRWTDEDSTCIIFNVSRNLTSAIILPAPCFITHLLLHSVTLTSQLASLFWA